MSNKANIMLSQRRTSYGRTSETVVALLSSHGWWKFSHA